MTLQIERLDAHGDGLAIASGKRLGYCSASCVAEERVTVEITSNERLYSKAKLIEVLEKSEVRNDGLVQCKYFGDCGGCQYQMISYEEQLEIKRGVVERAFSRFSGLDPALVPAVLPTIPSPNQYSYRTKLTPHFELPYELRRGRRTGIRNNANGNGDGAEKPKYNVPIGFDCIGTKRVMDIEECPIATKTINHALPAAKQKSAIRSSRSRMALQSFCVTRCAPTRALLKTDLSRKPHPQMERWRRNSIRKLSRPQGDSQGTCAGYQV